ncbi:ABC transporter permease [Erysipelothrix sp. strain 2 (EsS2-6-Brazil)]|uniref:ABC transporter permease n=1 Tax=Erysipelothrix sp. strain 2 (EsS2-6-Brazil) TaxID=2500549 RepID=UPI00190A6F2C|nr:ABC transporter permease [Erysipelothrix sp. strain 2 (EsS2-6-Brazil)]MBK2402812.1 ABC transporter permease [Erysipelothrix sp. strain 2 (EsS2-6-Brazil)]
MVIKMAFKNVRKSYKDYTVYFVTLAFSVALFYIFGSFQDQAGILELTNQMGRTFELVSEALNVISFIVVVIFAFLIVYANNFIIGRRKQEFGLYMLLGMSRFKMSLILMAETFLIGLAALAVGLFSGYILTQITSVLMGTILAVPIHYQFIFSTQGAQRTIYCFSGIFVLIMFLNQRKLRKITLNELFNAHRTQEMLRNVSVWWTVFQLIGAIAILIFDYLWVLKAGQLIFFMPIIVGIGIFATILLFKSMAEFVEYFVHINRSRYYRNLNLFVVRQVSNKIRSTYRVMAVVSITLLFGITILATGLNLNKRISNFAVETIPYDASFTFMYDDVGTVKNYYNDLNLNEYFSSGFQINLYRSESFDTEVFNIYDDIGEEKPVNEPLALMTLSDYNKVRTIQNKPLLTLSKNQIYFQPDYNNLITMRARLVDVLDYRKPLTLGSVDYFLQPYDEANFVIFSNQSNGYPILVAHEDDVNSIKATWPDVFIKTVVSGNALHSTEGDIERILEHVQEGQTQDLTNYYDTDVLTRYNSGLTGMGTEIIIAAIGLYVGMVLLIVSLVILALQQLSEASDNQGRYETLRKIGASHGMINRALLKQTALYFFIPLGVALIHTVVGLIAVERNLNLINLGYTSNVLSVSTVVIVFMFYLIYFVITYFNSKRIIKVKRK